MTTYSFPQSPYLNHWLTQIDVETNFVDYQRIKPIARIGFHAVRLSAIAVEKIAFAALSLNKFFKSVYRSIVHWGKRVTPSVAPMPESVKALFANWARVEAHYRQFSCLEKSCPSKFLDSLSFDERRDLLIAWIETLRLEKKFDAETTLYFDQFLRFAEGDYALNKQDLQAYPAAIRNWRIKAPLEAFVHSIDKTREAERKITVEDVRNDFTLLLKFPHLLRRPEIVAQVTNAPSHLRTKIVEAKGNLYLRDLRAAQKQERAVLGRADLYSSMDLDQLRETYFSEEELRYVEHRVGEIEQKLQGDIPLQYYDKRILSIESELLKAERQAYTAAHAFIEGAPELHLDHIERAREELRTALLSRIACSIHILQRLNINGAFAQIDEHASIEQLSNQIAQLQSLEQEHAGKFSGEELERLRGEIGKLTEIHSHWIHTRTSREPWSVLDQLKTTEQRIEERTHGFAKNLILLCLDLHADCHAPLVIAGEDSRREEHARRNDGTNTSKLIVKAATDFAETIVAKHLARFKAALSSRAEFQARISGQIDPSNHLLDYRSLSQTLEFTEELSSFYKTVQSLWVEHMPDEQAKEIATLSGTKKEEKANDCFCSWIEQKTGVKITVGLRFDRFSLPQPVSPEALEEIGTKIGEEVKRREKERSADFKTGGQQALERIRASNEAPDRDIEAPDLPIELIAPIVAQDLPSTPIAVTLLPNGAAPGRRMSGENFIDQIDQIRADVDSTLSPYEQAIEWVMSLKEHPHLAHFPDTRLHLLAAFREFALRILSGEGNVNEEMKNAFLEQFQLNGRFHFEGMYSAELSYFTDTYLILAIALNTQKYEMSSLQREYFIQLLNLSQLPHLWIQAAKKKIIISERGSPLGAEIAEIGRAIQATSLGLEGVEETVLQRSFKDSALPTGDKTRKLLDFYSARSDEQLPPSLLADLDFTLDLSHDQDCDAMERALTKALQCARASGQGDQIIRDYFTSKLANPPRSPFADRSKLQLATHYFFKRLDTKLFFDERKMRAELELNEAHFISSNEAPVRLYGYALQISLLSRYLLECQKKNETPHKELIVDLLIYKIAYRDLKGTYFDGKKEIAGFLKQAADEAEFRMIETADYVRAIAATDPQALFATIDERAKEIGQHAQILVDRLMKINRTHPIQTSPSALFLSMGRSVSIDAATGKIYYDGEQQSSLPQILQNHPSIRALDLHHLPYIYDAVRNVFVYYTKSEDGREKIPQILIRQIDDQVLIQKRLPTRFDDQETSLLSYHPKENVQLPVALLHRLEIDSFWEDEEHTLYGFDTEGTLIAKLPEQEGSYTEIVTPSGVWHQIAEPLQGETLVIAQLLQRSFASDEILYREGQFWIPALKLRLIKQPDSGVWVAELPGMSRKMLDVEYMEKDERSSLVFKNEVAALKIASLQRALEKARYRLSLEERRGIPNGQKHTIKELEKTVARLEKELIETEERVFVSALEEETYHSERLEQKLQANGQFIFQKFQNSLREMYETLAHPERLTPEEQLDLLAAYLERRKEWKEICDRPLALTFYTDSSNARIGTKGVTEILDLIHRADLNQEELLSELVRELAKYPISHSLNEVQFALLMKAIGKLPPNTELALYVELYLYQHYIYQRGELANTSLAGKEAEIEALEAHIEEAAARCADKLNQIDEKSASSHLLNLWRQTGLLPEHPLLQSRPTVFPDKDDSTRSIAAQKLKDLASRSLLERVSSEESIEFQPKVLASEIQEEQEKAIAAFAKHSKSQVEGFYLEEMGNFRLDGLYSEFNIDQGNERGLYGIDKKVVRKMFNYLLEQGAIVSQKGSTSYYKLASPFVATKEFNAGAIRALLTDQNLTDAQIDRIVERVRLFLARAAQSGFLSSFKIGEEAKIEEALLAAKQKHLAELLHFESLLEHERKGHSASWADLKYAFVSGDYSRFGNEVSTHLRLSRAMALYLFHKTEMQHIENVLKAPLLGERNKIELLMTKRNYPVDLLLEQIKPDETAKRKEQIIQRAFLAFEEDYGFRCNLMQVKLFRSLVLDNDDEEAIDAVQARMGFGKTALLPLMAIIQIATEKGLPEERRHLVRYVVPRAVIEDNTSSFNQRLSAILGSKAIKDQDFSRYQIQDGSETVSFRLIIEDLEARKRSYFRARSLGQVIIQWPEIRSSMESQELEFGKLLIEGNLGDEERELCLRAKQLLNEIRSLPTYTVFDELDDTQNIQSREVNFTRGRKFPIAEDSIVPLERLVSFVESHKQLDWKNLQQTAETLLRALCTQRDGSPIQAISPRVIAYLTNAQERINEESKAILSDALAVNPGDPASHHTENDSMFFLIRAILLDANMLALVTSKLPNTHFGVRFAERDGERVYFSDPESESPLLIAVPYEGTNTPKGLSVFDNTEVAAITTLRYYSTPETLFQPQPHLDFLMRQIRRDKIPPRLVAEYGQRALMEELQQISSMLDPQEFKQAKERFFETHMRRPSEGFRQFFATVVIATQIRSDEASTKSDRYERGSLDNIEKGCSGTIGGTSSYFKREEKDAAADGKMSIEIMGRDNNREIKWLTPPQPDGDYLQSILTTLLDAANPKTRAIVDAAGICKSRDGTPETVVKELWTLLKARAQFASITGIVYYGKDNVKRLYRGPALDPIPCTTAIELQALSQRSLFSFYGQKNTRGSDIKQANQSHALVTIDGNVSNSDAKQAVLRFRNLVNRSSGQTFSFAAMPEFEKTVKDSIQSQIEKMIVQNDAEIQKLERTPLSDLEDLPNGQKWTERDQRDHLTQLRRLNEQLRTRLGEVADSTLSTVDIANHLRVSELNAEEKNALIIFNREMKAHVKQAASHLETVVLDQKPDIEPYLEFLRVRDQITRFAEESIRTLFLKYGTPISAVDRDQYVEQQTAIAKQNIEHLMRAVETCTGRAPQAAIMRRYTDEIDHSAHLFKERYAQTTPVYTSSAVASDAQAIAVALAQALAEAQAEAVVLAESLNETEVVVDDRKGPPNIRMANLPKIEIPLDFIQQPETLDTVVLYPLLNELIRPDLRERFRISPLLKARSAVSHFALYDPTETKDPIFITQEEAAEIQKQGDEGKLHTDYQLLNTRNIRYPIRPQGAENGARAPLLDQLYCSAMGGNEIPAVYPKTEELRTTQLTNVESAQLLPHLTQIGSSPYWKLGRFGVSKEFSHTVTFKAPRLFNAHFMPLDPAPLEITIPVKGRAIEVRIPRTNRWLNREFKAHRVDQPQTVTTIHRKAETEFGRLREEMARLRELRAQCEKLNERSKRDIQAFRSFNIDKKLEEGLNARDKEFSADRLYRSVGQDTIGLFKDTERLFVAAKQQFKVEDLKALQAKFKEFISPEALLRFRQIGAARYTYEHLYMGALATRNQVIENELADRTGPGQSIDFTKAPLLEQNYIRIVDKVHSRSVFDAAQCGKEDCRQLFLNLIPETIRTISELEALINSVEANNREIARITAEIERLESISKEGFEALQTLETLQRVEEDVERTLSREGFIVAEGTFFDQFSFATLLEDVEVPPTEIQLSGTIPGYTHVVATMHNVGNALKGFRRTTEGRVVESNDRFLEHVLRMAAQVEERTPEVTLN